MSRRRSVCLAGDSALHARLLALASASLLVLPQAALAQPAKAPAAAQQVGPAAADLGRMSIEDLMTIDVTSASRKEQRGADVAAAIFVITHDAIRRSGMTTVPDVLRLAPGVEVARISPSKWAVSMRGFNSGFANKLLVLIDGRSVYNRLFSGVLWDAEDLMLDDIERIEVIRGPGAAMWGANAVNGVINIVTKSAADTQGGFVRVDGDSDGRQAAARYGGTIGRATFRVHSQWSSAEESLTPEGAPADDGARALTAGFRTDGTVGSNAFMVGGTLTAERARAIWLNFDSKTLGTPFANYPYDSRSGNIVGRWTHTEADRDSLQVQGFVDLASLDQPIAAYSRHNVNVDMQYHTFIGTRHDLVGGAAYWLVSDNYVGNRGFSLTTPAAQSSLVTSFVQDEISLFGKRLAIMLGTQVQYDSASHSGVQPTARVMWKLDPRQRIWAATSHALRTASRFEREIRVELPPVATVVGLPLFTTALGNPNLKDETLIGSSASLDVTTYAGRYANLVTSEINTPVIEFAPTPRILVTSHFENQLAATTRGVEISGHWSPLSAWRLDGSYTGFHLTPHLAASSTDPVAAAQDGSAPRAQWNLNSAFVICNHTTVNIGLFRVGRLEQLNVPAYTRGDVSAEWRLRPRLSVTAIGQNLLSKSHREFDSASALILSTQVSRSASLRVRWTF